MLGACTLWQRALAETTASWGTEGFALQHIRPAPLLPLPHLLQHPPYSVGKRGKPYYKAARTRPKAQTTIVTVDSQQACECVAERLLTRQSRKFIRVVRPPTLQASLDCHVHIRQPRNSVCTTSSSFRTRRVRSPGTAARRL